MPLPRTWTLAAGLLLALSSRLVALPLIWPIDGPSPLTGAADTEWLQPTVSGDPDSGRFGCVRNSGYRFHEAIDIASRQQDKRGESTDPVKAVMPGTVVYINDNGSNSSFGRYIVIEHRELTPALYTLYSHLRAVEDNLKVGQNVSAGTVIATLGRTPTRDISKDRAHVHLEIGLRMTDDFQTWYNRKGFGSKNDHGVWNGMNLVGLDPLDFYQAFHAGQVGSLKAYWRSLPPGAVLHVRTNAIPDLVRRYPSLLDGPLPASVEGWELTITGYGLPLKLRPLTEDEAKAAGAVGSVKIAAVDPAELKRWACRDMVKWNGKTATLDDGGRDLLTLLFKLRE